MRRPAGLVAILLLLATAAPVMACVTNVVMSHEESACCVAMHRQFGHMEEIGCCQTEIRTDETSLIAAFPAVHVQWFCVGICPRSSLRFIGGADWYRYVGF